MKPLYKYNKKKPKTKQKKTHYTPSLIHPPKQGLFPRLGQQWGGHPPHLRGHTTVHFWRTLVTTTPRWEHCGWDSRRRWGRDKKQHWLLSSGKTTKIISVLPKCFIEAFISSFFFSSFFLICNLSCSCSPFVVWGLKYTHSSFSTVEQSTPHQDYSSK